MLRWPPIAVFVLAVALPAWAQERLVLTAPEAMALALRDNPELAAIRQRAGIAAADIVIARSLPVGPEWSGEIRGVTGPRSELRDHFTTFHALLFTLQPRGARGLREQAAAAGFSRVEAEIAHEETKLALAVYRAVHDLLQRQERLTVAEKLARQTEEVAKALAKAGGQLKVTQVDLLLVRTDLAEAQVQVQAARQAHLTAAQELRRLLGVPSAALTVRGTLAVDRLAWDADALQPVALERRNDLQARRLAVGEAEARLRLERVMRFGSPTLGPSYEFNEDRLSFIGAQFTVPIPVHNKRGDIQKREAELTQALLQVRQTEIEIQIELRAALEQLRQAEAEAAAYDKDVLPVIRGARDVTAKLVARAFEDTDPVRLLEFERRVARAEDGYVGARWNVIAARARLAAAVGDAGLAVEAAPR